MFEFIEEIILSPFVLFMVLAAIMIGVTSYAFRQKEYAGYALGWLVGILIIIVFQALTGGQQTGEEAPDVEFTFRSLNGFVVVVISTLGIVAGYGSLFFMDSFRRTHRRQSVSIAIGTCLLVVAMYFVLGLSDRASYMIGLFGLGVTIGALTNRVLDSTPVPTRQFTQQRMDESRNQPLSNQPDAPYDRPDGRPIGGFDNQQGGPPPQADVDRQRERFEQLRRPDRRQ